jgi:hypothetical protein
MNVHVYDSQVVGETTSTLFTMVQASPVNALITLHNGGSHTINYSFQALQGDGTWADIEELSPANDINSTLVAGQQKAIVVNSTTGQVQLVGNADGGSLLYFSVTRIYTRASGGPIPLLAF